MHSFIIFACAWICETSDLSFASMRTTAPFEVFSTLMFAFDIDDMCWLHISPPDPCIEPCGDVELPVEPVVPIEPELPDPDPIEPELPVELPLVPLVPLEPLALDPLPLLPVEPAPLLPEPELPDCA